MSDLTTRGTPRRRVRPGATPQERIEMHSQEDPATGCWVWTAAIDKGGYGRVSIRGRLLHAHRVSYETFVGPIPEGFQVDHLCRNRACCNPAHLEPVTPAENTRRSPIHNHAKTACPQGHEYDEANTWHYAGRRYCRTCNNEYKRAWERRNRAAKRAA